MQKRNQALILTILILCVLTQSAQALTINISRSISVNDTDSVSTGDAGYDKTPSVIGSTSVTLDTEGSSAELGYRFTGFNSGRGAFNLSQQVRSITQNITATVTWTLTEDAPGEIYSFTLNPELHAYLNILDDREGESGDQAAISNFSATLKQNNGTISDSLDLTGGSRTTVGSSSVNDTNDSQTFTNLTGDHTFELTYTGNTTAAWKIAGGGDNRTADAVLWGQDGSMDGGAEFSDSFDNYSNAIARNADGLFVPATVELIVIPELSSLGLVGIALAGFFFLFRSGI